MTPVERHVDRLLEVLRTTIRKRGTTQLKIQHALGWGPSYISQILTKQKHVRIDHVALILGFLGVEPADFYAEVFPPSEQLDALSPAIAPSAGTRLRLEEVRSLQALVGDLASLLESRGLFTASELTKAVEAARASRRSTI